MSEAPSGLCFLDTNILVYAMDGDDTVRSAVARRIIAELIRNNRLCTSTQILQELYVTLTRKGRRTITHEEALHYLDNIARCPVATIDYAAIRAATGLCVQQVLSFWDALIVIAAARSGAKYLITEDLQHGRSVLGIEIVNPFLEV